MDKSWFNYYFFFMHNYTFINFINIKINFKSNDICIEFINQFKRF